MFVSDWMTKKVYTVTQNDSVSDAIKLLKEKKVKHLPVVKDGNKIVGILSDRDIKGYTPSKVSTFDIHELNYILFTTKVTKIMVKNVITAARHGGNRFYVVMEDKPGVTGKVLDIVKKHGFTLDSVLTTYEGVKKGYKRVVVRTIGKDGYVEKARGELNNLFGGPFM